MLKKDMVEILNTQINKELESAYMYMDMANRFTEDGLDGFAHWYMVQAEEEIDHAKKFANYLHDENEKVELADLKIKKVDYESPLRILEEGYKHERYVTELIDNIYSLALDEGDFRTRNFLEWFIAEQAEEELNAKTLIDKFQKFASYSLYELDRELGERK